MDFPFIDRKYNSIQYIPNILKPNNLGGKHTENFELIILPDDDPEMRLYNLELLDKYGTEGKPIVFVRMRSHPEEKVYQGYMNLYIPVAT